MAKTSRKQDSLLRERVQLPDGQIVAVFREDERLDPLIGHVQRSRLSHGAFEYKVKLIENDRPRWFNQKHILPIVGWKIGPVRTFHKVRVTWDPIEDGNIPTPE